MEQALMAVCKDIRLGKILIQTNHDTGEPEVPRPPLHTQFSHDFKSFIGKTNQKKKQKQHLINSIKRFCGKNLAIHL